MLLRSLSLLILVCTQNSIFGSIENSKPKEDASVLSSRESGTLFNIISYHNTSDEKRLRKLDKFLSSDASKINASDERGRTALHTAITFKKDFVIEYLSKHGARHIPDLDGNYPLHGVETLPILKKLLQNFPGIDVNIKNSRNETLKDIITQKLSGLMRSRNSNTPSGYINEYVSLHMNEYTNAPIDKQINKKQLLLDYLLRYPKSKALHRACVKGNFDTIIRLLQEGALSISQIERAIIQYIVLLN